jgi:transcriptional regulator with XRE-family HTH domain
MHKWYAYKQTTRKLQLVQDVQRVVGAKIRQLRLQKKWSQDVFADISGIHRAQVGAMERGEMNMTLKTLKTVADALKVRIRDLVEDA